MKSIFLLSLRGIQAKTIFTILDMVEVLCRDYDSKMDHPELQRKNKYADH